MEQDLAWSGNCLGKGGMKTNILNVRRYFNLVAALPAIGLLMFTGCSGIDGTSQNRSMTNNRVATYMEQTSQTAQADAAGPGYEWFY